MTSVRAWLLAAVGLVGAGVAAAQPVPGLGPVPAPFIPMQGEDAFERRTVLGKPYLAHTETEALQTLPDGNRICGTWTGLVARDGDGRVRREQPLAAIGPLLAAPDAPRIVVVADPVLRVIWLLDSDRRTARRRPWPPEGGRGMTGGPPFRPKGQRLEPTVEPLGVREIAGVEAEGTRSTVVIPAGAIGNERPLSIVDERWSSPDLGVVLEMRHSDPRFGETRFQVTSLERGEPDRALFEVPGDYRVEEGPPEPGDGPGRPGARPKASPKRP